MSRKKTKLSNFRHLDVNIQYEPVIQKYAKECADILKNNSPEKTGAYAQGWAVDEKKDVRGRWYVATVWNEDHYRLTHLLENGHIIANKRGGVGWSSARPHIAKAYRSIKPSFLRAIENVEIEVEIE